MSEAGTSSNSKLKREKGIEDIKMFSEAIKSVAQQMPESTDEGERKFGLMASEMFGTLAEAAELGQEFGGTLSLLTMAKKYAEMINEGNTENVDLAKAQGIQNISQLFGNVAEQIPEGNMKIYSDIVSAMFSGTAEHIATAQPEITSMASGLLAAFKCAKKYPKLTASNGQKTSNPGKNVAQQQQKIAKELVKEVAKTTGGKIGQLILQICGGEMKATVQNTANGTNALVQSAMIQGARNVHHVNLQIREEHLD